MFITYTGNIQLIYHQQRWKYLFVVGLSYVRKYAKNANLIDGIPGKLLSKLEGCDNIDKPTFIFSLCNCQGVAKVPRSMALQASS